MPNPVASLPAVSVIVPNYNHSRFLSARFKSILSQTYRGFEIVVLDDCSTDDSVRCIESLLETTPHVLLKNVTNSGSPFSQWLRGIQASKGQYIWIAESDDISLPDFLETAMNSFADGANFFYCRNSSIDEYGRNLKWPFWGDGLNPKWFKKDFVMTGNEFVARFMANRNVIPNASAVVFDRSLLRIDPSVLSMKYAGDWLIWSLMLNSQDVTLHYSAKEMDCHRCHASSSREELSKAKVLQRIREAVIVFTAVNRMVGASYCCLLRRCWHSDLSWLRHQLWREIRLRGFINVVFPLVRVGPIGVALTVAVMSERFYEKMKLV